MKIAVNVLKILNLILTSIWGILFGILTPLSIMFGDIVDPTISQHYILIVWMVNSVVCYITGTVFIMLKMYKTACCFHGVGLVVVLFIYGVFQSLYVGHEASNPAQLYMPIIFVTLLTLLITVLANWKKIDERLKTSKNKAYEPAPSILGGLTTETEKAEKRKKK